MSNFHQANTKPDLASGVSPAEGTFDAQCDLAALVYKDDDDPDGVLRAFAARIHEQGLRAVGLVQAGHHCVNGPELTAMLVHTGKELRLFQDLGAGATGCRLDVGQLTEAGSQIAYAIDQGADILIINRFGRQEREGKGLLYLVERALSADIPVVIAVSEAGFSNWIRFSGGMSVKLGCDQDALNSWWNSISSRGDGLPLQIQQTVCATLK